MFQTRNASTPYLFFLATVILARFNVWLAVSQMGSVDSSEACSMQLPKILSYFFVCTGHKWRSGSSCWGVTIYKRRCLCRLLAGRLSNQTSWGLRREKEDVLRFWECHSLIVPLSKLNRSMLGRGQKRGRLLLNPSSLTKSWKSSVQDGWRCGYLSSISSNLMMDELSLYCRWHC